MGTAIDVALGLILTYLLLGMLASSSQELFVGIIKLRGRKLIGALDRLLAGNVVTSDVQTLAERLKAHSLVKPLGATDKPSYLPAKNFSLALMDCLSQGGQAPAFSQIENGVAQLPASPVKSSLSTLLKRAGGDLDALQGHIESWFNDAMDRASGEYKRFSQYFLLAFGFIVAVALNIDSIHIATTLWTEPSSARTAIVQAAAVAASKPAPGSSATTDAQSSSDSAAAALQQLQALPIPIGWVDVTRDTGETTNPLAILVHSVFQDGAHGLWRVLGWILTAFGVSLGAPFWFNALQQLMGLRASGPKPPRSDP
jgi:hypothetical protein